MTSDCKLNAIMQRIIAENPRASQERLRALFLAAVEDDQQAAREAVDYFVSEELRKRRQ
jgi:hypothetical protein